MTYANSKLILDIIKNEIIFTRRDILNKINISEGSIRRLIRKLIEDGLIRRIENNSRNETYYHIDNVHFLKHNKDRNYKGFTNHRKIIDFIYTKKVFTINEISFSLKIEYHNATTLIRKMHKDGKLDLIGKISNKNIYAIKEIKINTYIDRYMNNKANACKIFDFNGKKEAILLFIKKEKLITCNSLKNEFNISRHVAYQCLMKMVNTDEVIVYDKVLYGAKDTDINDELIKNKKNALCYNSLNDIESTRNKIVEFIKNNSICDVKKISSGTGINSDLSSNHARKCVKLGILSYTILHNKRFYYYKDNELDLINKGIIKIGSIDKKEKIMINKQNIFSQLFIDMKPFY